MSLSLPAISSLFFLRGKKRKRRKKGGHLTTYNIPLPHNPPPSTVTHAPLIWLAARLARNTTVPAISSGRPRRPFGFCCATASSPPCLAIRPEAIFEGKKPGAMLLLRMWRGPRSTARLRVRWITAAVWKEAGKSGSG